VRKRHPRVRVSAARPCARLLLLQHRMLRARLMASAPGRTRSSECPPGCSTHPAHIRQTSGHSSRAILPALLVNMLHLRRHTSVRAWWLKVPLRRSGSSAAIQRRYMTPGSCCSAADTRLNHAAPAEDRTHQRNLMRNTADSLQAVLNALLALILPACPDPERHEATCALQATCAAFKQMLGQKHAVHHAIA